MIEKKKTLVQFLFSEAVKDRKVPTVTPGKTVLCAFVFNLTEHRPQKTWESAAKLVNTA